MATLKITRNILGILGRLELKLDHLRVVRGVVIHESAAASEGHDPVVDCVGPGNKLIRGGIVGELDAEVLSLWWHSHMTTARWGPPLTELSQ